MLDLKQKDIIYYSRIIPSASLYDVCELKVRTIEDNWLVAVDKRDKHAYLFYDNDLNKTIFIDRKDALNRVKEAEKNKKEITTETYYEEY